MSNRTLDQPDQFRFETLEEGEILEPIPCDLRSSEEREPLTQQRYMVADYLNQQYPFCPESLEEGEILDQAESMDICALDPRETIHVLEPRQYMAMNEPSEIESLEDGEIFEPEKYMTTNKAIKVESLAQEGKFEVTFRMDTSILEQSNVFPTESLEERKRCEERDITGELVNEGDKYRKIRFIGQGGEGSCYLSKRISDCALRVCKVYPKRRTQFDGGLPREVQILTDYLPPNDRIVHFHEVILTGGVAHVYFDYYSGGDLENFIYNYRNLGTKVPESFIWHALLHLAEALAYIHYGYDRHSNQRAPSEWWQVIHRDIKPSNILLRLPAYTPNAHNITDYPYPSLVLADFGLASLEDTDYPIGSYLWQPPEIPEASPAADCWALGACIHALALEGKPPIKRLPKIYRKTRRNRRLWVTDPDARGPRSVAGVYSQELQDCLAGTFIVDPSQRLDAIEILACATQYSERPPWRKAPWEPLEASVFAERCDFN